MAIPLCPTYVPPSLKCATGEKTQAIGKKKLKQVFNTYMMLIKAKVLLLEIFMEISEHGKKVLFTEKILPIFFADFRQRYLDV